MSASVAFGAARWTAKQPPRPGQKPTSSSTVARFHRGACIAPQRGCNELVDGLDWKKRLLTAARQPQRTDEDRFGAPHARPLLGGLALHILIEVQSALRGGL